MDITIDEGAAATFAVPAAVPRDVEMILINLVGKLLTFLPEHGGTCNDFNGEVTVLLDAEVDGVRLLALRREMVASGYPNKTIASVLEISSWTVASHLRRIFMKLNVSSRAAMAARLTGAALSEMSLSNIDPHEPVFPARGSLRGIGT